MVAAGLVTQLTGKADRSVPIFFSFPLGSSYQPPCYRTVLAMPAKTDSDGKADLAQLRESNMTLTRTHNHSLG